MSLAALIRRNWLDTEMRTEINWGKVEQYAQEMRDGAGFPPPVVFIDPADELVRVGDGFHRILACKRNGQKAVLVDLRRGSRRDAFLHGIEVNRLQKGLPFSFGDLEKCILTLLKDEETSKWTQTKIADTIGCSYSYTSQTVKKFRDVIERPDTVVDRNGVVKRRWTKQEPDEEPDNRQAPATIPCPHCDGTGRIPAWEGACA
ncbi:MAG TPA: hypothetical protein VGY58_15645 [Gemmataceae bacterium]|nr:hypothetical protein [Gemmataceae bacterium]